MKPYAIPQMEQMVDKGCSTPGCTHTDHKEIFVHQRCHPRASLDARYEKGSGVLNLICSECKLPVLECGGGLNMKLWNWIKERGRIFWVRWNCEHNVHPDHAKGWVCIKCGKTMWL